MIRHKAVDLLSRREHSRSELSGKLLGRGYDPDLVANVLLVLEERDYLSDERFAEQFVAQLVRKGYGEHGVRAKLVQRGVASNLARRVIEEQNVDWFEHALETLRARRTRLDDETERDIMDKIRMKQARFLRARGFSTEQILYAIDATK